MKISFVISYQQTKFEAVGFGDFERNVSLLMKLGYDGVEIALRDPELLDPVILGSQLNKVGLKLAALGTGQAFVDEGISLTDSEGQVRQKALERVKKHIDFASELNSQVIIGLIRGKIIGPTLKERQIGFLEESIKELCSYAEKKGVLLLVEPLNRYECNLLNTAAEVMDLIKHVGSPALKLLLDTFHMNIEEVDMVKTLSESKPYISYMHLADSNRKFPGLGHIDFSAIYKTLKEMDFHGYLSGEILPYPDLETAIQQYIMRVKEVLNG